MSSWHTLYRPQAMKDLHLDGVRTQMQSYMKSGIFPRVFLFAGPKGTGKTSTSRIVGAILNDEANKKAVEYAFFNKGDGVIPFSEPDEQSESLRKIMSGNSYVVQELDAASNRGIDDVRALKERVHLPPQEGFVTVYILDEAHMLTTEAFNALLKLLEEPPSHAVFILATTEKHKIPDTVLSRATQIHFTLANQQELLRALQSVLDKVGITSDIEVLHAITAQAGGSFRDAVKLLEMVYTAAAGDPSKNEKSEIHLTSAHLQAAIPSLLDDALLYRLLSSVIEKDAHATVEIFEQMRSSGVDAGYCYTRLLNILHGALLAAYGSDTHAQYVKEFLTKEIALYLLDKLQFISAQKELIPFLQLELILLSIIEKASNKPNKTGSKTKKTNGSDGGDSDLDRKKLHSTTVSSHTDTAQNNIQLLENWDAFVELVKLKNTSLAALLNSSKPVPAKSNGVAHIQVFYQFHKDQLMQPKFLQILQESAHQLTGSDIPFQFEFELDTTEALVEDLIM